MAVLEMHHHKKPAPPMTSKQTEVFNASQRQARTRTSQPSVTSQVADPFSICQPSE